MASVFSQLHNGPALCSPGVFPGHVPALCACVVLHSHRTSLATASAQSVTALQPGPKLPFLLFPDKNRTQKLTAQTFLNAGSEAGLLSPPLGYTQRTSIPMPGGRNMGSTGWRGQDMTLRLHGQTFLYRLTRHHQEQPGQQTPALSWNMSRRYK